MQSWELLGVSTTASVDEIKKAYREKMLAAHPDRHPADRFDAQVELAKLLNIARDEMLRGCLGARAWHPPQEESKKATTPRYRGVGDDFSDDKFFAAGDYVVEIVACWERRARSGREAVVVVARVVYSSVGVPVGATREWWCMLDAYKSFDYLTALLRACHFDANEERMEQAVGAGQPLAGHAVRLRCTMIKKANGGDFTVHEWSPLQGLAA